MGRQMSSSIEKAKTPYLATFADGDERAEQWTMLTKSGDGRVQHTATLSPPPFIPLERIALFHPEKQLLELSRRCLKDKGRARVEGDTRVSSRHPWMPSQGFPPETDCDSCSARSCTRSNTQAQCRAALKAHRVHTFLVQNTLFMTEQ